MSKKAIFLLKSSRGQSMSRKLYVSNPLHLMEEVSFPELPPGLLAVSSHNGRYLYCVLSGLFDRSFVRSLEEVVKTYFPERLTFVPLAENLFQEEEESPTTDLVEEKSLGPDLHS